MPISTHVHILVIDDAPESLQRLPSTLREQGWRISVATTGRQGFHRAQALSPDIILLDVQMPGMDGFATCRLLQESPRTHGIPVIFLTAVGDDVQRLKGLQNGGSDYVVKPFLPAEIVARIRIHLQRSSPRPVASSAEPMVLLSQGEITLRSAMRLISENLADLPPLVDIAHEVGTHDKKLSAIFRQHLGVTVFAWAREERLRVAREWLANSHMDIADVAEQVGFHSAANFATAFRHRLGVTPSQYRQNLREASANSGSDAT